MSRQGGEKIIVYTEMSKNTGSAGGCALVFTVPGTVNKIDEGLYFTEVGNTETVWCYCMT